MSLAPYADLDAVRAEAAAHGERVVYGASVQGRPLEAYRRHGDGPRVVVTAGLHGPEWIGVRVALAVLAAGPLEGARLEVVPVVNPDGYARVQLAEGGGRLASLRPNARGVDLNRNFPLPWGARPSRLPFAGSTTEGGATWRGPHPLSEPETEALAAWLAADPPHAAVGLHSFMGTQIPARVWHPSDWRGYGRLTRAFRRAQGGFGYPRLASPVFDVFTGELEDWLHHVLGSWAVCIECFPVAASLAQHLRAPSTFWRFNPRDPTSVVERDAPATRALLQEALTLPRPPRRPGADRTLPAW